VVRAAKAVPYRKILRSSDFEVAVCEIRNLRARYFRSVDDVSGLVSKRALYPGDILDRAWVTERELVRSGDTVRLWVLGKRINISTLARALQSGKLGERIRVKNIDTNRAIRALVIGKGEVRVKF
jgi:flagella basal body P-ring formation protein FlgA